MKTASRAFSDAAGDFNLLCRFVSQNHDHLRAHSTWCLGRVVDWRYGLYGNKTTIAGFWERNAQLLFDGFGELAGFAISENGDSDFAILALPGYRFLFEEMLQWIVENWGHREGAPIIEVTEEQGLERAILDRFAFRQARTFYTRCFDLAGELPERYPLEAGFTIVDMQAHPDYRAQRILRADAFGDESSLTEEELQRQIEFYNYAQRGPIYHPQCDLGVMAEDGRFVSGCEALIDARSAVADIERVCTHSAFRRRGFARAVLQECLYRLRDIGIQRAYITGYGPGAIALYGSLGHVAEFKRFEYKKEGLP